MPPSLRPPGTKSLYVDSSLYQVGTIFESHGILLSSGDALRWASLHNLLVSCTRVSDVFSLDVLQTKGDEAHTQSAGGKPRKHLVTVGQVFTRTLQECLSEGDVGSADLTPLAYARAWAAFMVECVGALRDAEVASSSLAGEYRVRNRMRRSIDSRCNCLHWLRHRCCVHGSPQSTLQGSPRMPCKPT